MTKASQQQPNIHFELYQGDRQEITTPCTNGEHAAWLVMVNGETLETFVPIGRTNDEREDRFYDALEMLRHVANGDWEDWEKGHHFPKYPVKVPEGFVQGTRSLTADGSELIKQNDGTWKLLKNGQVVEAPVNAIRAAYHDTADLVVTGSFALNLIGYLGGNYARKVCDTLNLGKGKAGPAADAAIAAARARKAIYQSEKRQDTTGEATKSNGNGGVRVRSVGNVDFNMNTLSPGTQFRLVGIDNAGNVLDEGSDQTWEPASSDHKVMIENLQLATKGGLRVLVL